MILRRPTNEGVVGLLKAVLWSKLNYQRCRNNDLFVGRSPILGQNVLPISLLSNKTGLPTCRPKPSLVGLKHSPDFGGFKEAKHLENKI